jgi:hypothetical protein
MKNKNLIMIIGNGFDLAHKLPTSYNDFSEYLINKIIIDELLEEKKPKFVKQEFIANLKTQSTRHFEENLEYRLLCNSIVRKSREETRVKIFENKKKLLLESLKNDFLKKLINNNYDNWFDIEQAYFDELLILFDKTEGNNRQKNIGNLNIEFEEIKNELISYLKSIRNNGYKKISHFKKDFHITWDNIYIINFNYTDTIFEYYNETKTENPKININFIHGDIDDDKSEIVFGFGNDQHYRYKELKQSKIEECLKYFKTYSYLRKKEYQKIFSEAVEIFDEYEVAILGHSLGETDKTLLNEIFENSKCNKIHLYKRSDLNNNPERQLREHNKLFYAISRIISDDSVTRKKVINYEESLSFP